MSIIFNSESYFQHLFLKYKEEILGSKVVEVERIIPILEGSTNRSVLELVTSKLGYKPDYLEYDEKYLVFVHYLPEEYILCFKCVNNTVRVAVASGTLTLEAIEEFLNSFEEFLPSSNPESPEAIYRVLLHYDKGRTLQETKLVKFEDIRENYPVAVQEKFKQLTSPDALNGQSGKLIIWHGPPGTGKTYLIRALARELADKGASIHLLGDTEQFLASTGKIIHAVTDTYSPSSTHIPRQEVQGLKLFILEDQGQLFLSNCRESPGFSSFLNMTEGFIGQGCNAVFIVTCNERIDSIDPAIVRKGRCVQQCSFEKLRGEEMLSWLSKKGVTITEELKAKSSVGLALSDLYAYIRDQECSVTTLDTFGFHS